MKLFSLLSVVMKHTCAHTASYSYRFNVNQKSKSCFLDEPCVYLSWPTDRRWLRTSRLKSGVELLSFNTGLFALAQEQIYEVLYSFTHPVFPGPVCTSLSRSSSAEQSSMLHRMYLQVAAGCSSGPANGTPARRECGPGSHRAWASALPLYWSLFQRLAYTFSPRCSPAFIPINWNFSGSRPRFDRIPWIPERRDFWPSSRIYRKSSFLRRLSRNCNLSRITILRWFRHHLSLGDYWGGG